MKLSDFEAFIDPTILARGKAYYEDGCVISLQEMNRGVFVAKVKGSELYEVEVVCGSDGKIRSTLCHCPFDMGEYCKHEVAVLYEMRQLKEETNAGHTAGGTEKVALRLILSKRSKNELLEFILTLAKENQDAAERVELAFTQKGQDFDLQQCKQLIRTHIKRNSDRHGFVSYRNVPGAVKGAELVLERACKAYEQHAYLPSFSLCLCAIHEMFDMLSCSDDSAGIIGGVIEEGFTGIQEIVQDPDTTQRTEMFRLLLKETEAEVYDGWPDWRLQFMEAACFLADTPALRMEWDEKLGFFESRYKGESWSTDYFAEQAALLRYEMVRQFEGEEATVHFIRQNLSFSAFRKIAIRNALDRGEYEEAIQLALEGEEQDGQKRLPGLVSQWNALRYEAYERADQVDLQRELGLELTLNGSYEYYNRLKQTYSAALWPTVYPKILDGLEQSGANVLEIYTQILVAENELERLLDFVSRHPHRIEQFYPQLIGNYAEEVYRLFMQHIQQTAASASSRSEYKRICGIIRTVVKTGGKAEAREIVQTLLNRYPRRPAFCEELNKVRI